MAAAGCAGAVWSGFCDDLFYGIWSLKAVVSCRLSVVSKDRKLTTFPKLGRVQGDHRDLRGAVEAERKANGADASIDIELHLVEVVVAFGVFLAQRRQDERAEEWKSDLAAVRVTGEHEVDEMAARMGDDVVGVIGFVGHKNDGSIGFSGDG